MRERKRASARETREAAAAAVLAAGNVVPMTRAEHRALTNLAHVEAGHGPQRAVIGGDSQDGEDPAAQLARGKEAKAVAGKRRKDATDDPQLLHRRELSRNAAARRRAAAKARAELAENQKPADPSTLPDSSKMIRDALAHPEPAPTRPVMRQELEGSLEAYFHLQVRRRLGGVVVKLVPTERGMPDRMVLLPGGRIVLLELKTTTGRRSASQIHWHERAAALGTTVPTLGGRLAVDLWIQKQLP